jgi:6-phosphogluconolactonase (cycloisomerase 2 family)
MDFKRFAIVIVLLATLGLSACGGGGGGGSGGLFGGPSAGTDGGTTGGGTTDGGTTSGGTGGGGTPDTTPPMVSTVSPATDATSVALDSAITASFSEDMDPSTIAAANFTLDQGVMGNVSYDAASRAATFTPGAILAPNTTYTATITAGVKDLAGNALAANHAWSFSTAGSGAAAPVYPRFAYVANSESDTVSAYAVEASTGRLKFIGKAPSGDAPYAIAADPSGKYLYVTNYGGGTISQYSINIDGRLTAMTPATIAAGTYPYAITVDPSGKYVYVPNYGSDTVSQYAIGTGGALSAIGATGAVAAGAHPVAVAVDPSAKYAYVANSGDGGTPSTVSQYAIGPSGQLTALTPATVAAGIGPSAVAVDLSGKYVYVPNAGSNAVSQYTIGAGGSLTAIGSPVPAGSSPAAITVDPGGKYAYVANSGEYGTQDSTVSQYAIGSGGVLAPMATPSVAAGRLATSAVADPSGKYVYVANLSSGDISQYQVGADGALTANAPSRIAAPSARAIAIGKGSAPVQVVPKYAYALNGGSNNVSQYAIGADGKLTQIGSPVPTGTNPGSMSVHPGGKHVYVASAGSSNISQYAVGGDGSLAAIGLPVAAGGYAGGITVHSSGMFAYAVTSQDFYNNNSTVSRYAIGADGALVSTSSVTVATGSSLQPVTIDPSGRYAYTVSSLDGTITRFAIGSDGSWSLPSTLKAHPTLGSGAMPVTIDPSGRYAYVLNPANNWGAQFSIGPDGVLSPLSPANFNTGTGQTTPISIAIDPAGKYAYVARYNDGYVSQYTIGADGALSPMSTGEVFVGLNARSITVDASGKYAYVANLVGGSVRQLTIGAGGTLTPMTPSSVSAGTMPFSVITTGAYQ